VLLILAHAAWGVFLYPLSWAARYYSAFLFIFGIVYIIKKRNRNQESLLLSAYVVGAEILLRITDGASYEFAKYTICIYALLGLYYSGFSKKAYLYLLYLLLLVPGVLISIEFDALNKRMVNEIISNISGPICLGVMALYTLDKKITFHQLSNMLLAIALPILSACCYVYVYGPSVRYISSVESNGYFSGMFGPNQVATSLGLGMLIFYLRTIFNSGSKSAMALNLLIASFLFYNGLLIFSRAGMIAGVCTFAVSCLFLLARSRKQGRLQTRTAFVAFAVSVFAVFTLVSFQTNGLLVKRYTNRDHLGRTKRDKDTDRKALAKQEVEMFIEHPILGTGTVEAAKIRAVTHQRKIQSHDEITRLLAEHGSLGFLALLILVLVPGWLFFSRPHLLIVTFFSFWFLTINHSGIRLSASAFLYALMLLQVELSPRDFRVKKLGWNSDSRKRLYAIRAASST